MAFYYTHTLKMLNYISFFVSFVCFVHILTLPGFSDARYKEESSRTVVNCKRGKTHSNP